MRRTGFAWLSALRLHTALRRSVHGFCFVFCAPTFSVKDHLVPQQRLAVLWATLRTAAAQVVCICHGFRHRDRPVDSENQPGRLQAARIVYVYPATRSSFQRNSRERLALVQHFAARILCAFLHL